jgi:hypothetical protein
MVRDSPAIKTHIFCSLQAFIRLEKMLAENIISNWYELQRSLFTLVVRNYIVENLTNTCTAEYKWMAIIRSHSKIVETLDFSLTGRGI